MARPKIVCLCGSTKFGNAFQKAQLDETLAGHIVLTIGCNMRSDADLFAHLTDAERDAVKQRLDELHLRKLDIADEVLILNVGGYIGNSTRRELRYALMLDKPVRWLEPDNSDSELQPALADVAAGKQRRDASFPADELGQKIIGWSLALMASKRDGSFLKTDCIAYNIGVSQARSEAEAIGFGILTARQRLPESDGWYSHVCSAAAIYLTQEITFGQQTS